MIRVVVRDGLRKECDQHTDLAVAIGVSIAEPLRYFGDRCPLCPEAPPNPVDPDGPRFRGKVRS